MKVVLVGVSVLQLFGFGVQAQEGLLTTIKPVGEGGIPVPIANGAKFIPLCDCQRGAFDSQILGISPNGRFVVGRSISNVGFEAFLCSPAYGMNGLGESMACPKKNVTLARRASEREKPRNRCQYSPSLARRATGRLFAMGHVFRTGHTKLADDVSADGSVVVGRDSIQIGLAENGDDVAAAFDEHKRICRLLSEQGFPSC